MEPDGGGGGGGGGGGAVEPRPQPIFAAALWNRRCAIWCIAAATGWTGGG